MSDCDSNVTEGRPGMSVSDRPEISDNDLPLSRLVYDNLKSF